MPFQFFWYWCLSALLYFLYMLQKSINASSYVQVFFHVQRYFVYIKLIIFCHIEGCAWDGMQYGKLVWYSTQDISTPVAIMVLTILTSIVKLPSVAWNSGSVVVNSGFSYDELDSVLGVAFLAVT